MVAKNFYDAVLVGLDLRTLLAAALLAKRGMRVLLLAHGRPWPSYEFAGLELPRAPFSLAGSDSPAIQRVFAEIALKPLLTRRLAALAPAFQVVARGHRFDVTRERGTMLRELERELPDARRFADELYGALAANQANIHALLKRDLMWPPEGFFERREFNQTGADTAFASALADGEQTLSDESGFGAVLDRLLRFVDGSSSARGFDARLLRLLAARLECAEIREGGLATLYQLLIESIRTHNGQVRLNERVEALTVRRGVVTNLHLAPSDEDIACHYLLWGLPVARLAAMLPDRSELDPLFAEVGEPRVSHHRFTLNLVVKREAMPECLARDALLLADEPLWVECDRPPQRPHATLTVEALLPAESSEQRALRLADQRERMLAGLAELSPFLRSHLVFVDSPHDGRPIEDLQTGARIDPPDVHSRGPDTMASVYTFPRLRLHGTVGLTIRTPLKRVLLCNEQVVVGLGLEGAFLTAWSAARAVTRSLRRGWMNRGRWTKVEL